MLRSHMSYNYSPMSEVFLLFLALGLKTKQPWNRKPQSQRPGVKDQRSHRVKRQRRPTPESNTTESNTTESNTRSNRVKHHRVKHHRVKHHRIKHQESQSQTPGVTESNTRVQHQESQSQTPLSRWSRSITKLTSSIYQSIIHLSDVMLSSI